MKICIDDGDRLILSAPPGGNATVILLIVVGTVISAGGSAFLRFGLNESQLPLTLLGGLAGVVGLAILIGGIATAFTRDRLELDRVTERGRWTRRLLGRMIKPPIEFAFAQVKHVTTEKFVDSSPRTDRAGSTSVEKIRACLLITKPRERIELDEAERNHAPRVEAVAQSVAAFLKLEVEKTKDGWSA